MGAERGSNKARCSLENRADLSGGGFKSPHLRPGATEAEVHVRCWGATTPRRAASKPPALLTFEKPQQPDLLKLAHQPLLHGNLFAVSLTIK